MYARHTPMHPNFVDAQTYKEEMQQSAMSTLLQDRGAPRPAAAPLQTSGPSADKHHLAPQDDSRASADSIFTEPDVEKVERHARLSGEEVTDHLHDVLARSQNKASGEVEAGHLDGLQTAWAELDRTKALLGVKTRQLPLSFAAEAAEKEVLAMLNADSTDVSSDGGLHSSRMHALDDEVTSAIQQAKREDSAFSFSEATGSATGEDSTGKKDLEVMLEEVKRLEKLRASEADPKQKEQLKHQVRSEMKALLSQVQKTKAQVKNAQVQAEDSSKLGSVQPRTLTDRKTFEERRGYLDTYPEPGTESRPSAATEERKRDPPQCMRNCTWQWPSMPGYSSV